MNDIVLVPITDIALRPDPYPLQPEVRAVGACTYGSVRLKGFRIIRNAEGRYRLFFCNLPHFRRCRACDAHVPVEHIYCGFCGRELPAFVPPMKRNGHPDRYRVASHPLDPATRLRFEAAFFAAYLSPRSREARPWT